MQKKLIALAFIVTLGFNYAFAQKGVDDGSRYGKGEDSIRCVQNLSLFTTYVQSQNFKDAYEFWLSVYKECPQASRNIYIHGVKIIAWQIEQEKDATKRKALIDKLMAVYDQRIKYYGEDSRYPTPWILGRKAIDYITYATDDKLKKQAYEWLEQSMDGMQERTELTVFHYFMVLSNQLYTTDPTHKEKYINDFLKVSKYLDLEAKSGSSSNDEYISKVKEEIEASFAQSGAADCKTLQGLYGPKVEENKANIEWLKSAITLMRKVNCKEIEAYFTASAYAHKIEPTAESAVGCASLALKKGNQNQAIEYFEQAVSLENDNANKADYFFNIAVLLLDQRSLVRARSYALKSIDANPNNGSAYILIAKMYASDAKNSSSDPVLAKAAYYAVVDKLEKAKSVDPSVADEANKLISIYRQYFPSSEEVFMHNELGKGKVITIGGWIGERTVVR
ncbi:MAG: tetratricopeptide repeat protein [Bacteroidales bacterium]|nr:tetratricopeptide repeat protein [Bacteroidales bacterium]